MKTLLLIIDMQNDFCRPDGALFVKGASEDTIRLGKFIRKNAYRIDHIIMTMDSHHVLDISHPGFWEDPDGNPPAPFTEINMESISQGKWMPRYHRAEVLEYVDELGKQGEFPHVIWPEHCIIGSSGAAIVDEIMQPVKTWARTGNYFDIVVKGTNPLTEHFGALMASIPVVDSPETQLNTALISKLKRFDNILIAGEAKTHCVATTIRQMLEIKGIAEKLVILVDCMSDIPGFEPLALPIYEKAGKEGARIVLSTEWP